MKIWQCAMFSTLFAWSPQPCLAEAWELVQADTAPVDNLHKNRTPGGSPPTGSALPEAGVKRSTRPTCPARSTSCCCGFWR